jgi:TolB-like protein
MNSFITELKRRKVFQVGVAYIVLAWVIAQVMDLALENFAAPDWVIKTVLTLLVVGFPIAVFLAWAYDLTPEGIKLTEDASPETSGAEAAVAPPAAIKQSIAVLPFADMSPEKDQEYFSDGIAEELLNQLTKLKGLHVAGRTSSFFFKGKNEDLRDIGEKLNVAHILEGSVRKAGNRVRITAQLVKAADGYHIWSETFDRDLDDIFAIQDETAKSVAGALSIQLGVGETEFGDGGTQNPEAFDAYLNGLSLYHQFGRRETAEAINSLEKAVELDPNFVLAWGWLAQIYDNAAFSFLSEQAEELGKRSEEAAQRAISIAPEAIASIRALALLKTRNREWAEADQQWRRALAAAPGDAHSNYEYGRFLLHVGRAKDALHYCQRAVQIDPLSLIPCVLLAVVHQVNGNTEEALKEFRRGEGLIGNEQFLSSVTLVCAMEQNDRALMEQSLDKMLEGEPFLPDDESITRSMRTRLDSPEEARKELRRFDVDPDYDTPIGRTVITVWAAYFGDYELALKQFQDVSQDRAVAIFLVWRPIQKGMRLLPAFKDLLRDFKLVDYWQSTGNWGDFCRPVGDGDFECL